MKLQRPDSSIVIAQCISKGKLLSSMLLSMATQDANAHLVYRDCRKPEVNSTIEAEFQLASVKLFFQTPSTDASGRIFSETYVVLGILHPSAPPQVASASNFEPEKGNREAACGPVKTILKVHTQKDEYPLGSPEPGRSLIYIIQQDEFRVHMIGHFPTRFGLDGEWIGGDSDNSYFYTLIEPGEHHIFGEWQIDFKHYAQPVSLAKFSVKSGEAYFFRARVVFSSISGEGERSIQIEPISAEEGKQLISASPLSITTTN